MTNKSKLLSSARIPTSLEFFSHLKWLDGRPLLDTVEEYRRDIFTKALDTYDQNGRPAYSMVLAGRAKKNNKTTDLVLAAFYKLLIPHSHQGNNGFICANDEDQAHDDLDLARKLVAVNPDLAAELETLQKEIRRRDGGGTLRILPAHDIAGAHGKSGNYVAFDEIHSQKNHDLFEALAADPTRIDALTWITSYDSVYATPGIPLFDFKQIGFAGSDPKMLFSWYSGDRCTDPTFADLPPEQRANPSMSSWPDGEEYLQQQKRRLPSAKYRRLHLNLPGSVSGAFFDQGTILKAVDTGVRQRPWRDGVRYHAAIDMSGGSSDDAVLAIAHVEDGVAVLDLVVKQAGAPPFNPRDAVERFANYMQSYGLNRAVSDAYGGMTFYFDFQSRNITLSKCHRSASDSFEHIEPAFNSGSIRLLDVTELVDQFQTLVVRGSKIDHEPGGHNDFANAATLALNAARDAAERGAGDLVTSVPAPGNPIYGTGAETLNDHGRWRAMCCDGEAAFAMTERIRQAVVAAEQDRIKRLAEKTS